MVHMPVTMPNPTNSAPLIGSGASIFAKQAGFSKKKQVLDSEDTFTA